LPLLKFQPSYIDGLHPLS